MKLKKAKLRKIISEELVRVLMENDTKRTLALREGKEAPKTTKETLKETALCADALTKALAKESQLDSWAEAKIVKAATYLQEVSEHIQIETLLEDMATPSATTLGMDGDHFATDTLGLADPHATDANEDSWFNNIQVASRILEDLPLEDLPDQVTLATKLLRDTIDVMTNPLVEEE